MKNVWTWLRDQVEAGREQVKNLWASTANSDEAIEGEAAAVRQTIETPGWKYINDYIWEELQSCLRDIEDREKTSQQREYSAGFLAGLGMYLKIIRRILNRARQRELSKKDST